MRSRSSRCPPESAMATVTGTPASWARPSAVAIILRAPAAVGRLVSATYISGPPSLALYWLMPVSHIEHFLVAADDIDATRDWYAQIVGLSPGPHPEFGFPVHWMYMGDVDLVHIGPSARGANENQRKYLGRTSQDAGAGTGAIDHIAFRTTGLRDMLAHLRAHGVPFSQRRANGQA